MEWHLTTHSKSYLFECPFPHCCYKCSATSALKLHHKSHKNGCTVCCVDFASFELLKKHRSLKICGKKIKEEQVETQVTDQPDLRSKEEHIKQEIKIEPSDV